MKGGLIHKIVMLKLVYMPKVEEKNLIPREIFPQLISHLEEPEITLLVGARQTGKTVLLGMIKEYLLATKRISSDNILYFNLDIMKDWEFFQSQTEFIKFLKERAGKDKIYVLIDEAQRVPECTRFFKGVYDSNLNVKMVLTGSASLELKTRLRESMAGRKQVFHLFPFSFSEFLQAKNKKLGEFLEKKDISKLSRKELISLFKEYIVWGGYPRVVFSEKKEQKERILAEIYTSYVEKDIVGFLEIKNRLGFSKLVKLLAGQVGQLVNVNELSNSLNLDRGTIERYLKALEETFVISTVSPYFKNPRQEIIKQNKVYFNDTGLRNYAVGNFSEFEERLDAGLILENAVFKEIAVSLKPLEKIRFWRTKAGSEVDFLVVKGRDILPIEVKLNIKDLRIPLGLKHYLEKYPTNKALVVNFNIYNKSLDKVNFIHPYEIKAKK